MFARSFALKTFQLNQRFYSAPVIQHVAIIGSGQMGGGIAQASAQAGFKVTLVDTQEEILKKNLGLVHKSVSRVAKKKFQDESEASAFVDKTMGLISTTTSPKDAASQADLVVEAIIENIEIKKNLFKEMESAAKPTTILASNTSSLNIKDIAALCERKGNVAGLHFFNPVAMMKLVEVVKATETKDEVHEALMSFSKEIGKHPVSCVDQPGFIVNKLLVPYMFKAVQMYENGEATKEDIDAAMKLGAGYPMGPFALMDYVGLDTLKFINDGWRAEDPTNPDFAASGVVDKLVSEGKLGKKTGEGFYKY